MIRAGLVLAILLAACSGTAVQPTGATPSPTQGASPEIQASPSETSEAGDGALCAQGHEPCPLEPGTYSSAPFEPEFMFTVDAGWQNDRAYADGGGISKGVGGLYWASGVSGGTVGDEEVEIGATPDEFLAFLQSLAAVGMTVSEPTRTTVDGIEGQQLDVTSNEVEAFGLFFLAEDQFNLAPDEKARFIALDKDGDTVVLILDSFEAAGFDDWLETVGPVVESISWE